MACRRITRQAVSIASWLEEESEEIDDLDDEDSVQVSDHETESEQSANEADPLTPPPGPQYTGKDKVTLWDVHPPNQRTRRRRRNIVIHPPGVKAVARDAKSVLDSWKLFFPDELLLQISEYTNQRLR